LVGIAEARPVHNFRQRVQRLGFHPVCNAPARVPAALSHALLPRPFDSYCPLGVEPPASAIEKVSLAATAPRASRTHSFAAPYARSSPVSKTLISLVSLFNAPPMASISLQQLTRFVWSPSAGRIIGEIAWRQRFPDIEYRSHDTPSCLHHVCPLKEGRVARHAIIQQAFIACAWSAAEGVGVAEVHVYWTKAHEGAGYLGTKAKRNSFVRCQMNDEPICSQAIDRRLAKEHERCFLKLNRNFS